MRGEISPMIAKASTSTRPKLRSKRAEIAELLVGVQFLRHKTAGEAGFRSRIGRQMARRGAVRGGDKASRLAKHGEPRNTAIAADLGRCGGRSAHRGQRERIVNPPSRRRPS